MPTININPKTIFPTQLYLHGWPTSAFLISRLQIIHMVLYALHLILYDEYDVHAYICYVHWKINYKTSCIFMNLMKNMW